MLSTNNVSLAYGKRVLFDEVNISFHKGNCYGIIGANGAGKSTFMKILSGEIEPNKGTVSLSPNERLSMLKQNHFEFNDFSVINTVLMGNKHLWDIQQEKDALYAKEDFTEEDGLKAGELEAEFGEMGGYTSESDAAQLLANLGIMDDVHQTLMADLTGTQKVRVLLAQSLFGNPDVLLLDEPTNDIDVNTLRSLEEAIENFVGCVVVISHDRWFIDRVATHILAFEGDSQVYFFEGNYHDYEENKKQRLGETQPHRPRFKKLVN